MKIGAINFDDECKLLSYVRDKYGNAIELRVDANGAFSSADWQEKLQALSVFKLHSIEQPVPPNEHLLMAEVTRKSPVPVALDEDIVQYPQNKPPGQLLDKLKPLYIVLKPGIIGGFAKTREWIDEAQKRGIKWWITSALESNIGLNAIAQFTLGHKNNEYHGLGTGQLYSNNVASPLATEKGNFIVNTRQKWDVSAILNH
ncbi:MAG: hypothetical protein HC896_14935 [Bacteroidales bacterium]|nr:hypothetical protein [Bacteroidales bacterium]